jgi:1,4-dihydroxy-2-naphthoate polyprenyltransferase
MKYWILAARPKTLWAGICPVMIGTALAIAEDQLHVPSVLAALAGALLIQIGTNFANDYYDGVKGTDDAERLGPPRAVASGFISGTAMKHAMILTFILVFVPGAYIMLRGGIPFLIIGVVSILSGLAYTGGPYPLAYHGLGDIFALVFFGPVAVGGTYYLQAHALPAEVIVAGISAGLFSVAILTVNNLRDRDGDARAGKKTLAVRFGAGFARWEYTLSLFAATIVIPAVLVVMQQGHYGALAGALAFVAAIPALRTVWTQTDGPSLNATLANTGKLLLLFSVLFSLGWILT